MKEAGWQTMKKEYSKPELDTKAYAQFESVFTGCDKNPGWGDCEFGEWHPSEGNSYCKHQNLMGK